MKAVNAVAGALSRVFLAGRGRSVLKLWLVPLIVVAGVIAAVITFAPEPSVAGVQRISSASIAEDGALGSSLAAPARNTGASALRLYDAKARSSASQAAAVIAADALAAREHAFHLGHLAHLAHLRYLAQQAAAQAAAAKAAADRPAVTATVTSAPDPDRAPASNPPVPVTVPTTTYPGDYSCSALEQLWESAGGNPGDAFMAAEIATAESGGNPAAVSPTDDYGLWQINAVNAPGEEMLNPYANVREAILLSGDGTNWGPWTTYTSGAYEGRC